MPSVYLHKLVESTQEQPTAKLKKTTFGLKLQSPAMSVKVGVHDKKHDSAHRKVTATLVV